MLERAELVYLLRPYFNNLNKRLIRWPKLYFLDTGLATRLQGWSEVMPMLSSPNIGGLFETLVLSEIVKFIRNEGRDWELFFARTKDGQEVDFIIKTGDGTVHGFEAKYAIHGVSRPIAWPAAIRKEFSPKTPLIVVTSGGQQVMLSEDCITLPISELHRYLQTIAS